MELESFFKPIVLPEAPKQGAIYDQMRHIIFTLEELETFGQQSLYVVDYLTQRFLYVSPHPLFLCGFPRNRVKELGYNFYPKVVPENELQMLSEINEVGFNFFYNLPVEERSMTFLSYDFHIQHFHGHNLLINHKAKPLLLTEDGNIWLAMCRVSLSNQKKAGNVRLQLTNGTVDYDYSLAEKRLIPQTRKTLSEYEQQVLTLCAQGCKELQIAEITNLSVDNVKNIKRKIYKSMGVVNMTEAVYFAQAQGLI
ncbi:MAG: helix-turn-helix transcriptional regulator [Prevotellaceae bacterium]|jgi:DNA-binding CsgD family transcriptional regulator|nr:helix-turn-helix transcriptional regulator [Prevotellaceae bacterium]